MREAMRRKLGPMVPSPRLLHLLRSCLQAKMMLAPKPLTVESMSQPSPLDYKVPEKQRRRFWRTALAVISIFSGFMLTGFVLLELCMIAFGAPSGGAAKSYFWWEAIVLPFSLWLLIDGIRDLARGRR